MQIEKLQFHWECYYFWMLLQPTTDMDGSCLELNVFQRLNQYLVIRRRGAQAF